MDRWERKLRQLDQLNGLALIVIVVFISLLLASIILISAKAVSELAATNNDRRNQLLSRREISVTISQGGLSANILSARAGVVRFRIDNQDSRSHRLVLLTSNKQLIAYSMVVGPQQQNQVQWAVYPGRYRLTLGSATASEAAAQLKVIN